MQSLKGAEGLWTLVTLSALLITIIFCANASAAAKKDDHAWCYKDPSCDASHWADVCKTGKYQSPIDITKTEKREKQTRLRFNKQYMDTQNHFLIKNNGHTVQVQLNEDLSSKLMMDGDGLKGSYVFSQLHFHWGSHDDVGSEHLVKGVGSPAELHLVHYGSQYKGLGDAVGQKNPRALAVLGIFFEIGGNDNLALNPIIDAMKQATMDVTEKPVPIHANLNISSFLPSDLALYRYYGSLTTPTCNEVVHWNVFRNKVPISRSQLEAFRSVQDGQKAKLVDNYRPPMPLANRHVLEFERVVRDPMPESGTNDESKPEADSTDDFNEIFNSIEGKQESTTKKSSNSAANSKLQSISFAVVAAFTSVAIPVVMRSHH